MCMRRYFGVYGDQLRASGVELIGGVGALLGSPLAVFYRYSKNYSQSYIWGAFKQVIVCNGVHRSNVFVFRVRRSN